MGRCDTAPVVEVGHFFVDHATPERVEAAIKSGKRESDIPRYETLAEYRAKGGYSVLENAGPGSFRSTPSSRR